MKLKAEVKIWDTPEKPAPPSNSYRGGTSLDKPVEPQESKFTIYADTTDELKKKLSSIADLI